jgi:hypothetical protein
VVRVAQSFEENDYLHSSLERIHPYVLALIKLTETRPTSSDLLLTFVQQYGKKVYLHV